MVVRWYPIPHIALPSLASPSTTSLLEPADISPMHGRLAHKNFECECIVTSDGMGDSAGDRTRHLEIGLRVRAAMEGMTALNLPFPCVSKNRISFSWAVSALGDYIPSLAAAREGGGGVRCDVEGSAARRRG